MNIELSDRDRRWRSGVHHALADETRLAVVDALHLTDRSPSELGSLLGLSSNLLSHHLDVLEEAGVVQRRTSQGDGRRRYVTLLVDDPLADATLPTRPERVLFVCTRNAARSQLAAALWRLSTGGEATSAGAEPADRIDPGAVHVAAAHGLDLAGVRPRGYAAVQESVDLVVSVCDRAAEGPLPIAAPRIHWSVTDPVDGATADYEAAFEDIRWRITRLAAAA